MKYQVKTFRDEGLKARWTKTKKGAPIIAVRKPLESQWYIVHKDMFKRMQEVGVLEGFEEETVCGDFFNITV